MGWGLLFAIIGLPLIELYVFVQISHSIGFVSALLLVILSSLTGMALMRRQGISALLKVNSQLNAGGEPMTGLFDGLCLSIAGLLLFFPGLVSDVLAIPFLLPPVRRLLLGVWLRHVPPVQMHSAGGFGDAYPPPGGGSTVIDGDFTVVQDPKADEPPKALL